MYYNKGSMGRLSAFAKSTKNMLLYGNQESMTKPSGISSAKGDQKNLGKQPPKEIGSVAMPVNQVTTRQTDEITQADLQQAIIWSEILGKPVSKRRERRYYGN